VDLLKHCDKIQSMISLRSIVFTTLLALKQVGQITRGKYTFLHQSLPCYKNYLEEVSVCFIVKIMLYSVICQIAE